jgi:predicted PurR-regulated permease PerM
MTRAVKLHAVVVVLTVTIGGLVDGVIGAAIAVPLVSVVWSVVTTLRGLPGGIMPASSGGPHDPTQPPSD